MKKYLKIVGAILVIVGLVIIVYPVYTYYFTSKAQSDLKVEWQEYLKVKPEKPSSEQNNFIEDTSQPIVETKTPAKVSKIAIKPAFRLIIPKIKLDVIVVEGTDYAYLKYGPGYMKESAYPGEAGPCVISGHRTTYGAPFYRLNKLTKGDEIIIETLDDRFVYLVERNTSVKPDDLSILKPTVEPTLVLTTCTPIRSASKRLVVFASLADLSASGGK